MFKCFDVESYLCGDFVVFLGSWLLIASFLLFCGVARAAAMFALISKLITDVDVRKRDGTCK